MSDKDPRLETSSRNAFNGAIIPSSRDNAPNPDPLFWEDWKWQLRSAIRNTAHLKAELPALPPATVANIERNSRSRRFMITPYALSLVEKDSAGRPLEKDPLWLQLVAAWPVASDANYDPKGLGWEHPRDMVSANTQWKYPNRILVRITNSCLGLCQFCVLSQRTLEIKYDRRQLEEIEWQEALAFIKNTPQIEEVILSGGDPLLLVDSVIERRLADLRSASSTILIRLNTRALTHNPYRATETLARILGRSRVNTIGVHITHPREITAEFKTAVSRLHRHVPVMVSNIPLLRGVNDSVATMRTLCMGLYRLGIVGGYLFHYSPNTPGSLVFGTSISRGIEIIRGLRRYISGPAVPSYVLLHPDGKLNVPVEDCFSLVEEDDRGGYVRSVNWRGEMVDYRS